METAEKGLENSTRNSYLSDNAHHYRIGETQGIFPCSHLLFLYAAKTEF